MIEIKVDKDGTNSATVRISGDGTTIMKELAFAINQIYRSFCKHNDVFGECFRVVFTDIATGDDSPLWDRDDIPGETAVLMTENAGKKRTPDHEEDS